MVKITFNDLSLPLKTVVVLSWITGAFFVLAFIVGFISGVMGV